MSTQSQNLTKQVEFNQYLYLKLIFTDPEPRYKSDWMPVLFSRIDKSTPEKNELKAINFILEMTFEDSKPPYPIAVLVSDKNPVESDVVIFSKYALEVTKW